MGICMHMSASIAKEYPVTTVPTGENIAIETAAVQIRTLSIGAKTMTQGIYRQLPDQEVINTAGQINGTPWGVVNQHNGDCNGNEHLHVIWQLGDQLRKDYVLGPEDARFEHPAAARYAMAFIAEGATQFDIDSPLRAYRSREAPGGATARFSVVGMQFLANIPLRFLSAWEHGLNDLSDLRASAMEYSGTELVPSAEVAKLLPVDAYKASWRTLDELPQLFIGR